jgi:hypothetical protein
MTRVWRHFCLWHICDMAREVIEVGFEQRSGHAVSSAQRTVYEYTP